MYVKVREDAIQPGWTAFKGKKGYVEIRVVANWTTADPNDPGKYTVEQLFLEKKEDLDKIPELCEISIMFEDGTYVQLPLPAFKSIFLIIPKGEYTNAIYGD